MTAAYEFRTVTWRADDDEAQLVAVLNDLGHEGWQVVGVAPRFTTAPAPGRGGYARSDLVVLLQRPLDESEASGGP